MRKKPKLYKQLVIRISNRDVDRLDRLTAHYETTISGLLRMLIMKANQEIENGNTKKE